MEICVRYCSFFEVNSQFIPGILEAFVTFVHHDHIRVRTRSWYLFQRFVKHLRAQLGNVAPNVIEAIADLLPITARVPTDIPNEEMSSDDTSQNDEAVFTSQLYLFEAVGCIYSTPSVPAERQVFYAHSIVNPLFADIERHLGNAKSHDRGSILRIHHIIMALATLARGTSDWQPGVSSSGHNAPAPEVAVDFERTAEAILVALETLSFSIDIRTAARFAFSRLVGVIGVGILPQLPRWIDGLLSHSSTNDEIATFLRLLDQVVFAFKSDIANILDSLLNPLLQRVFTGLETKPLGTDDEIERSELCRELLNFLLVILHNDLGSVLVSPSKSRNGSDPSLLLTKDEANQQMFDPLINTCSQFAKSSSDLPTAKLAFTVFSRMSSYWGPGDIRTPIAARSGTKETAPPISSNPLPGFDNFMLQSFMPLCWALPIDPSFNTNDPQAHQVTSEIAGLLKVLWHKLGDRFTSYTREMVSPGLGDKKGEQFLAAVETMEERDFRRWFQVSFIFWTLIDQEECCSPP
jgi:exportin-T